MSPTKQKDLKAVCCWQSLAPTHQGTLWLLLQVTCLCHGPSSPRDCASPALGTHSWVSSGHHPGHVQLIICCTEITVAASNSGAKMKGNIFNTELAALRGSTWPRSNGELFEEDLKPLPDLPDSHLPACITHKEHSKPLYLHQR